LSAFTGHAVHAVAGIGNPNRFFESLRARGLIVHEHPFPDHHRFASTDLDFENNFPLIMTEKDAVRLGPQSRDSMWYLPVWAQLDSQFEQQLLLRVENYRSRTKDSP
jgi:tetraacyldisaccharide 4'-kinase